MNWTMEPPCPGDMVRVHAGGIWHYGIFVSVGEIIQFGYNPRLSNGDVSTVAVIGSDVPTFLQGGYMERAELSFLERHRRLSPEQTVAKARSRIGETGYSILYNNCEHFANECVFGVHGCSQTDSVRSVIKSLPFLEVYVAALPQKQPEGQLFPPLRQQQLELCSHPEVIRQRYYVWKLLECGLYRSLGLKLDDLQLSLGPEGKWSCKECYFSLSHSHNALAVAISRKPVGVDIERCPLPEKTAKVFLSDSELKAYGCLSAEERPLYLSRHWTGKESLFKQGEQPVFVPRDIPMSDDLRWEQLELAGESYCLCVANEDVKHLRFQLHCEEML